MDVEELICDMSLELLYATEIALTAYPARDEVQAAWLSSARYFLFLKTGAMRALELAILSINAAIRGTHINDPDHARFFRFLITLLADKYEATNSLEDLRTVVHAAAEMVASTPTDHPDGTSHFMVDYLNLVITMMFDRYQDIKSEEAPDDLHDQAGILSHIAAYLLDIFQGIGNLDYLQLSIDRSREAVDATTYDHPDRGLRLTRLAGSLGTRFQQTSKFEDLDEAIRRDEEAVACSPHGHPQLGLIFNNLASSLSIRFKCTSNFDDLDNAICRAKTAVDATPNESADRGMMLSNLASFLAIRFDHTHCLSDLQEAIDRARDALACTHDKNERSTRSSNLVTKLCQRFEQTGEFNDLQEAIRRGEEGVAATPDGHPDRQLRLANLAGCFALSFDSTGSLDSLQRCIELEEDALACTPDGSWDRASRLVSLADAYGQRFQRTMDMDNLQEAIRRAGEAVACTPADHADRSYTFGALGKHLMQRFDRTGDPKDLNEAIRRYREALDATPGIHPNRAENLRMYAQCMWEMFQLTGNPDDLDMAIRRNEESLAAATSESHVNRRGGLLQGLAKSLWLRFKHSGNVDDMERAIGTAEQALAAPPQDNPARVTIMIELASYLMQRFDRHGDPGDHDRSLRLLVECVEMDNAEPIYRIEAAIRAGKIASDKTWVEISEIAVKLLPNVTSRALKRSDQQFMAGQFPGLPSSAASAALQAGKGASHALGLLELGRGIITGLLFQGRTDLADLMEEHQEMAEKFKWLRDKLDAPSSSALLSEAAENARFTSNRNVSQRHNDSREFEKIVDEIRRLPNFKHFLLPPERDELNAVASSGPVAVINVSARRCDALLLDGHSVRALPLPLLRYSDIKENVRLLRLIRLCQAPTSTTTDEMSHMLAWLWDVAAGPILNELGFRGSPSNKWPHLWWIPTGILSLLPLHAAGRHLPESSEAVLDRVVSSYSPSIKALLHARQNTKQKILSRTFDDVLLVSMQTTPERSDLKFAAEEVEVLSHLLSNSVPELERPEPLKQPCRETVLAGLSACGVFHFAGHGQLDPSDPSKSCLLLTDWQRNPLTVEDLFGLNLQQKSPWLAYLSACSTGENQAERLYDEAIHLVTACKLAGFQHVVGSLWEVSDRYSVDAARHFYEALTRAIKDDGVIKDEAIALAVHKAARLLREETRNQNGRRRQGRPQEEDVEDEIGGSDPLLWAAYVHVGP